MTNLWHKVQLGEIVRHRKEFITIDDTQRYKRCRAQLHAKGIVLRDEIEGAEIKTKGQQVCRAGEFLVAEIDAKLGGFGIVPDELEGAIVSSHYFLFVVNEERLERKFLDYFIRTPGFRDQVRAQGSTNYAAIRPAHVLAYTIPLPPLEEQRRIVAKLDRIAAKVNRAHTLTEQANDLTPGISGSVQSAIFQAELNPTPLGEVCEVIDPNPSHRYPAYVADGIPLISSSEFEGRDHINPAGAKMVTEEFYRQTVGDWNIGAGDIIFSRKGKVGYARPHPPGQRLAMTHTLCVLKPRRALLDPAYLLQIARSPAFVRHLEQTMNPNTGVPTLGLNVIRETKIPLPSLITQSELAANGAASEIATDRLAELQRQSRRELAALMPSILDRAFRGEL